VNWSLFLFSDAVYCYCGFSWLVWKCSWIYALRVDCYSMQLVSSASCYAGVCSVRSPCWRNLSMAVPASSHSPAESLQICLHSCYRNTDAFHQMLSRSFNDVTLTLAILFAPKFNGLWWLPWELYSCVTGQFYVWSLLPSMLDTYFTDSYGDLTFGCK